jgi:hypothetical protein
MEEWGPNMPIFGFPVNLEDSGQNAFVQRWLSAWMDKHHFNTPDATAFGEVIEDIQGGYNYTDHERRRQAAMDAWRHAGEVYVVTTQDNRGHIVDQEVIDSNPTFTPSPMMTIRKGNINGGDTIKVDRRRSS